VETVTTDKDGKWAQAVNAILALLYTLAVVIWAVLIHDDLKGIRAALEAMAK
jgi:hypothetical protein